MTATICSFSVPVPPEHQLELRISCLPKFFHRHQRTALETSSFLLNIPGVYRDRSSQYDRFIQLEANGEK